jgi:excinuclease ABC subunit B
MPYVFFFFGDEIESLQRIDALTGEVQESFSEVTIYPSSHYVTSKERLELALIAIEKELEEHLTFLREHNKLLEAQRLEQRTRYDLELLRETGICSGIENYSRHLDGRKANEPCSTLFFLFAGRFDSVY